MKSIMESFSAADRKQMQDAADSVNAECLRMLAGEKNHVRTTALTLIAVAVVCIVLSVIAECLFA